jgi:hypothetical protein
MGAMALWVYCHTEITEITEMFLSRIGEFISVTIHEPFMVIPV